MIEKINAWKVGEETYGTLNEAKASALLALLPETFHDAATCISALIEKSDDVIAILRQKPRKSRAKSGRKHGSKTVKSAHALTSAATP